MQHILNETKNMKKGILLFALAGGICYVTLSSNASGGAAGPGIDGTKATGGVGCNDCHSSSTSVLVTVELDSAGVPVSQYFPGLSYTLKVSGTNNTTSNLPKFGFQVTVVKSTGAGTASAANAGTLVTTGLPTGCRYTSAATGGFGIAVFEQSSARTATTGTGTTGTTYVMGSLPWTAPASGTGTVKIYGCINAVNGNGSSSGDKYNYATPVSITEATPVQVKEVVTSIDANVFPNPVTNNMNIAFGNVEAGSYNVSVYDLNGKMVAGTIIEATGTAQNAAINTTNLVAGIYNVVISNGISTAKMHLLAI